RARERGGARVLRGERRQVDPREPRARLLGDPAAEPRPLSACGWRRHPRVRHGGPRCPARSLRGPCARIFPLPGGRRDGRRGRRSRRGGARACALTVHATLIRCVARPMADPKPRPALRIETLASTLEQKLDDEAAVLDVLVAALARGQNSELLWEQLHAAAARDDRTAELAFSYERLTRDKKFKSLTAAAQATVLGQAGVFSADVFGDAD